MRRKTILVIATLDTKGEEAGYLKREIEKRGKAVLVLDSGMSGEAVGVKPDVTRQEVAEAAGRTYESLEGIGRNAAEEIMARGVAGIVKHLYDERQFDGALAIGGSDGTLLASAGMRQLPIGVPKLIVSAMACGPTQFGHYVGTKDITIMPSVVDVAGLNPITRGIFDNAVAAICGMVDENRGIRLAEGRFVGLTMFGQTTPCGTVGKAILEKAGYETIIFHPNGTGGFVMEELIEEGAFCGVWDLTTQEISDEIVFGRSPAGPDRLTCSCDARCAPRLVVPGCVDFIWGAPEQIERFRGRRTYQFNSKVMLGKLTDAEMIEVADSMADRLNRCCSSVAAVFPLKGISMFDKEGEEFYDPDLDGLLFKRLRAGLDPRIELIEVDAHINDPRFAEACVSLLMEMIRSIRECSGRAPSRPSAPQGPED
ncbi:MAG: Tm-1-like ATP-binding domain-containing protein [Armatimonadetes bacterium]|nr:Tm-1-like ATP-binding domain-containing protein [Armatimonadota bacterium]